MMFLAQLTTVLKYESLAFLRSNFFISTLLLHFLGVCFCFFSRWLTIDFGVDIVYDFLSFYIYFIGSLLALFLGSRVLADHLKLGSAQSLLSFGIKRHVFYLGLLFSVFVNIGVFCLITYGFSLSLAFLSEIELLPLQSAFFIIYQCFGFFVLASIAFSLSVFCRFEVAFFASLGLFFIGLHLQSLIHINAKELFMAPVWMFLARVFDLSLFQMGYMDFADKDMSLMLHAFSYAGMLISAFVYLGALLFSRKNI